ncbi:TMV resistance protein N-like isoform X1 [Pyrus x bretschneideri]|uniref:TMV resistance protein N-like isoform X1 n=1 Tax=Pyrus x bretschneideri TaxID=225117 RepID=UPI002030DBDD|nr:TMV resistance protein N-like isoform X1 [Pyrus x bretschneideri]XP_048431409.1 TMV resistance protein N-like isoform X1 [Pyrus x bretschneideri]XP_048431410.1 TMV resistance protein N-like isoform X1 [Pyrus x bretschneideri]
MAGQLVSSSSFTSNPSWKYDVFLSFRGEDTRANFTDHLYKGLVDKGIHTFIDRQLPRGEEISPALLKTIEESKISLVIFSKSYASSRWCLDELVKILQCRESKKQIVLPVFYKVDPSHVRNQKSSFGDAFTDHKSKFKDKKEKVLMWRRALREVANLSGYPFLKGESEATFIGNIVEDILVKVRGDTCLNVAKHPVGIQSCVQEVKELLGVGGNNRCVVGIWGISGIGKTTIAKAVYNAIAHKFEGRCFLADVRETSASSQGVIQLQNTLLSKVLCGTELKAVDVHEGISLIKKLLRGKKILLILDDVDRLEQLNNLVEVDWFGEGSRVIITSKNRGLLESYGVELIYEVQKLMDDKALELLSLNAFGINEPPDDYLIFARRAIAYAQGLPLALNFIGSHLRKKSTDRWKAILDSYDSYVGEPYTGIQRILRKSYDAWDGVVQQVFLDIACFFKGRDKDYVLQILRSSKLNVPQDCIEVLVENAIITIEGNRILMHDLLEKMGKSIVYEESPTEPGKRSRLWFHEDVYHVLTENRGTKKVKGIVVELPEPNVITLNAESFSQMVNLEIFINRNACFFGHVDYLPNDLRWIDLSGRSNIHREHTVVFNLPSNYNPRHLVMFDISYSGIRQLKGFKNSAKLTSMNLSGCEFLEKIPDFSGIPNLKHLDLSECKSLVEVDDSVGFLDKLVEMDLSGCSRLTRFVTRLGLRSLKKLSLCGCTRLETFPVIENKMKSLWRLDIKRSGIRELPSSIVYLTGLESLEARGCENLTNMYIYGCPNLTTADLDILDDKCITIALSNLYYLDFRGCNLSESNFLVPLDCYSRLKFLDLSRNNFVSLPDCISQFSILEELSLSGCKRLREIPQVLPPILKHLYLDDCTSLEKMSKLPPMLERLDLRNCFGLRGDEVAKLENNLLLNQESLRCSKLAIILPGNEIPKWFRYISFEEPTTFEFCFEIPLNLQGDMLSGLALSFVLEPPFDQPRYISISGMPEVRYFWYGQDMKAAHVWLMLVDLDEHKQQGDFCQVIFCFQKGTCIKSCGVHPLRDEWF